MAETERKHYAVYTFCSDQTSLSFLPLAMNWAETCLIFCSALYLLYCNTDFAYLMEPIHRLYVIIHSVHRYKRTHNRYIQV